MGKSNITKFIVRETTDDDGLLLFSKVGNCMAFSASLKNHQILDLIIDPLDLNDGLTEDDVIKIVEIGTSLIFPAKMSKGTHMDSISVQSKFLEKKLIKRRELKANDWYLKADAVYVDSMYVAYNGVVSLVKTDLSDATHYGMGYVEDISPRGKAYYRKGQQFGFSLQDWVLAEDGTPLLDLLKPEIDRLASDIKVKECIKISINPKDYIGQYHILSGVSFYRMLWSNKYTTILKNMLRLIENGVDAWEALSFAYATKDKVDSYYGLAYVDTLFNPMDYVLRRLKNNNPINSSFSNGNRATDHKKYNEYIKLLELPPVMYRCIHVGNCKTLTFGKSYSVQNNDYHLKKVICDDGVTRYISSASFVKN